MNQCKTCGGIYQTTQADGTLYFHRCPPLSLPELIVAVNTGKVPLPVGETPDVAITRRTYERNALRDENVPSTLAKDAGKMIAPGSGTAPVVAPPPPVVVALP